MNGHSNTVTKRHAYISPGRKADIQSTKIKYIINKNLSTKYSYYKIELIFNTK